MDGREASQLPNPALGSEFLQMLVSGTVRTTFDSHALSGCNVHDIRAEAGLVSCKVFVRPETANMFGTMHGGCHATLIDVVSTAALVTVTGKPGVSVSLALNYVRPGAAQRELEVTSRVLKHGKRLATMVTEVVDVVSGDVCVTGTHVKSMGAQEVSLAGKL
jgi:acyl-coenzyme A thioesterase 13